jgi:hypothetical protein
MGYSLMSNSGYEFSMTNWTWHILLHIAKDHGWDPEGTELWVEDENGYIDFVGRLDGNDEESYTRYDGQRMSYFDMENMIAALKVASEDEEYRINGVIQVNSMSSFLPEIIDDLVVLQKTAYDCLYGDNPPDDLENSTVFQNYLKNEAHVAIF